MIDAANQTLLLHNLSFGERRRLIVPEINFILLLTSGFDDSLDCRIYDLHIVHLHAGADFVADFALFVGQQQRVSQQR